MSLDGLGNSAGGSGGGGGITTITSTGATIDITDPMGPSVNLEAGAVTAPLELQGTSDEAELIIAGDSGQSSNLTEWRQVSVSGTLVAWVDANGGIHAGLSGQGTLYCSAIAGKESAGNVIIDPSDGNGHTVGVWDERFGGGSDHFSQLQLNYWADSTHVAISPDTGGIHLLLKTTGGGLLEYDQANGVIGNGATPALNGNVGATNGPATAAQAGWVPMRFNGATYWVPVWQ